MSYALVKGGQVTERRPGRYETKVSDGATLSPPDGGWTDELAALCGFLPVTDTTQPPDTATTTHDRSVELIEGTPTVVWVERPKTQTELAGERREQHRSALDQAIAVAITDLLALAEYPALPEVPASTLPTIPAGTLTTAVLSDAVRVLRAECLTLRQVIGALRNEAQATRAGAQQVAEALANKIRLDRGDFAHLED